MEPQHFLQLGPGSLHSLGPKKSMFLLETAGDKAESEGQLRRGIEYYHKVAWKPGRAGQGLKLPHQTYSASHWLLGSGGGEQGWKPGQLPATARLSPG